VIVRAKVEHGRLVVDEPTDLPDGTVIDLVPAEELDAADRAELDRVLGLSIDEMDRGELEDGDAVLDRLRKRSA
jgi:hypothetical protein